jgi:hypothetical protein
VGNRVRYRFSIGRGAFHAGYRQGVDVDGLAGSKAGLGCLTFPLTRCRKSSGHVYRERAGEEFSPQAVAALTYPLLGLVPQGQASRTSSAVGGKGGVPQGEAAR